LKYAAFALFALSTLGCHSRSPYDITPEQAQRHSMKVLSGGKPIDLKSLPPGAVKHETVFHKGDVLPDGSISPGERHMVTITIPKQSGAMP